MSEFNNGIYSESLQENFKKFLASTFTNMGIGLVISSLVAYFTYRSLMTYGLAFQVLYKMGMGFMIIISLIQLGLVIFLNSKIYTMKPSTARITYFIYCVITGITFSYLPLIYDVEKVFMAFGFSAVLFGSCALIGHTTNIDLSKYSSLFLIGLLSLIILSLASIFLKISGLELIISYLGIILFLGITAWDVQKLKAIYFSTTGDEILQKNLGIYGAFQLYLDFINIFLYVLRILGRRRN